MVSQDYQRDEGSAAFRTMLELRIQAAVEYFVSNKPAGNKVWGEKSKKERKKEREGETAKEEIRKRTITQQDTHNGQTLRSLRLPAFIFIILFYFDLLVERC